MVKNYKVVSVGIPIVLKSSKIGAILLYNAKRQYLHTCKVSRYCLLAFHGRIAHLYLFNIDIFVFHRFFVFFHQNLKARCSSLCLLQHRNYMAYPSKHKTLNLYNICTVLGQRRRRWADAVQMLYKCFVFAEM